MTASLLRGVSGHARPSLGYALGEELLDPVSVDGDLAHVGAVRVQALVEADLLRSHKLQAHRVGPVRARAGALAGDGPRNLRLHAETLLKLVATVGVGH